MVAPIDSRFATRLRFLLTILFLFLVGIKPLHAQGCAGVPSSTPDKVTWTPAWCQEFTGAASSPDTMVWSFDLGNGGWGNNEVEVYCGPPGYAGNPSPCPSTFSTTTNTSYIDGNGHLVIQPINNNGTWISTRMKTQGIKNFQYGRIEASIQLPDTTNQGLWPAFWSLGSSITNTPWPICGEADIMENWSPSLFSGPGPNGNKATIHTSLTGGNGKGGSYTFPSGQQANTAFHSYGVIWSANLMQYYVDDPTKPFFVITPSDLAAGDTWPFNASMFLIANVAVGGTLGGSTASLVNSPPMTIDYVRQYTASSLPAPTLPNPPPITVKAGATMGNTSTFIPTLTPGTGFVYFTCTTNAPKAMCFMTTTDKLNPNVISSSNPAERITLTIATTANGAVPPPSYYLGMPVWLPIAMLCVLLSVTLGSVTGSGLHVRHRIPGLVAAGVILLAAIAACGGGTTPPPSPSGGTTPGSYNITISAYTQANITGSPDATAQIALTVN